MLTMEGEQAAEEARLFRFLFVPHLVLMAVYFIFGVCSSCLVSLTPRTHRHTTKAPGSHIVNQYRSPLTPLPPACFFVGPCHRSGISCRT